MKPSATISRKMAQAETNRHKEKAAHLFIGWAALLLGGSHSAAAPLCAILIAI
ncbi:MAG: hypothetical protein RR848_10090 [Oscillospiraceae bacterium]